MNSSSYNDAKPRRSLRIQLAKKKSVPELPLDIILIIISRFPLNSIIACKSLSKDFNHLISDPSFSRIYLTNKSHYFSTFFMDRSKEVFSLDLVEFEERDIFDNHEIDTTKATVVNLDRLIGGSFSACDRSSIRGYCNGLFCAMIVESDLYNLFVINPILSECIQLPEPLVLRKPKTICFVYGIGYCQFTNRYKVLRIITEYVGGRTYKNNTEIFTLGSDQKWRSVSDVNVPYDIKRQPPMVPFRSALHWIVQPFSLPSTIKIEPNWGCTRCICAFDMTQEKVNALPLSAELVACRGTTNLLSVLLDKLCIWKFSNLLEIEVWAMDEYGVEASWTRHFVLDLSTLIMESSLFSFTPFPESPEGVIVVSVCKRLAFYDMKKKEWLKAIEPKERIYLGNFVPCFDSLKNLIQG